MLLIFLVSLGLAAAGVRMGVASRFAASGSIIYLRMAERLNPADPDLRYRLGNAETYAPDGSDAEEGIRQLRRAADLSPHQTRFWEALAAACESSAKTECAGQATRRMLALSPMAPRVHWEAANYYLRANQHALALRQFRRLLQLDPGYAAPTFRICLGLAIVPEVIDREILTPAAGPHLKLAFADFLSNRGNDEYAFRVWKEVAASDSSFNFSAADPYLEHLIAARRYSAAAAVWRYLKRRKIVRTVGAPAPCNLIFNGSFEQAPLNAGFGWRYHQEPYVDVTFAAPGAHEGRRALRVDFTVSKNQEYEPVGQLIPVKANRAYWLSAHVRSEDITSDSGPRLRVIDPDCPSCLNVATGATVGTTSWHWVTLNFSTGPRTRLIRLSVWRPRSRTFPMGITGSFWLDSVSLRPAPAPAQPATLRSAR